MSAQNIVWHAHHITSAERCEQKGQKPCVLWFTGLSGSGKSTIANAVDALLFRDGHHAFLLDGDNVRHGLCKDLGFSDSDRTENIRRIGEVSKLFVDAGLFTLTAFISPFRKDRDLARAILPAGQFVEVYVDTPLDICEQRDPKGLYKKARAGLIKDFTGIDSPYEAPEKAEIHLQTAGKDIEACAQEVVDYLRANGYLQGA